MLSRLSFCRGALASRTATVFTPRVRFLSSAAEDEIKLEYLTGADDGIAVLTLNRPGAKNALGRVMMDQFQASIEELRGSSSIRSVVLRSSVDGVFCAGADLKERRSMSQAEATAFVNKLRRTFWEIQELPMPTIAAVEGAALGGGLELALACDLRIAGAKAKIGLPETKLAIIPGAGGTQRLPRVIGAARAKELIFTGRVLSGEGAEAMGIVNRVVPHGETFDSALDLAREILPQGPIALRMAKLAVNKGMQGDIASGMACEEAYYAQILPTKDRLEGLAAFKEKRKPVYKGE